MCLRILAAAAAWALAAGASAEVFQAIPGESSLTYRLKHPMHTVKGVTRDFLCKVDLAPDTVSSQVVVSADVRTFDSGISHRDEKARTLIRADEHPKVHFASDSVRRDGDSYRIYGRLTFAGRTHPVDFAVSPRKEEGKVKIDGGFSIKLTEYGVKPPSLALLDAEDKLDILFKLVALDPGRPAFDP